MDELHAAETARLAVASDVVYRCIADSENHHHRFLPASFSDFRVEEGGYGAGTVHSFTVRAAGNKQRMRMRVDEPDPGRVITETSLDRDMVTTFTVTPDGDGCHVRIETRWQPARGIVGVLERWFAPRLMRRIYREELGLLESYARGVSD